MRLRNTTIVVTGASSGLGRAMAGAFVEEGANRRLILEIARSARQRDRRGHESEFIGRHNGNYG